MFTGRVKPYTERGISRVPCSRCGKPSRYQWQVCANDRRFLGVCEECDIGLNRVALEFMGVPNSKELMLAYRAKVEAT